MADEIPVLDVVIAMNDYLRDLRDKVYDRIDYPLPTPAERLAERYGLDFADETIDAMLADGTYFGVVKRHFGDLAPPAVELLRANGIDPILSM